MVRPGFQTSEPVPGWMPDTRSENVFLLKERKWTCRFWTAKVPTFSLSHLTGTASESISVVQQEDFSGRKGRKEIRRRREMRQTGEEKPATLIFCWCGFRQARKGTSSLKEQPKLGGWAHKEQVFHAEAHILGSNWDNVRLCPLKARFSRDCVTECRCVNLTAQFLEVSTICQRPGMKPLSENILNDMSRIAWALRTCNVETSWRIWEIMDRYG